MTTLTVNLPTYPGPTVYPAATLFPGGRTIPANTQVVSHPVEQKGDNAS